jgi:hypothetical protein
MTWKDVRDQWQRSAVTPLPASTVKDTLRRAQRLQRRILWRDGLETVVALALLPIVFGWLLKAIHMHAIVPGASAALLLAWLLYVPWRLWRSRRLLPRKDPGLPLQRYLELERQAMLSQARMLEEIVWWYVAPWAVGIAGLTLGNRGLTTASLSHLAIVFALGVFIVHLNKRAARRTFRQRISDIDASRRELDTLEAATEPTIAQ